MLIELHIKVDVTYLGAYVDGGRGSSDLIMRLVVERRLQAPRVTHDVWRATLGGGAPRGCVLL